MWDHGYGKVDYHGEGSYVLFSEGNNPKSASILFGNHACFAVNPPGMYPWRNALLQTRNYSVFATGDTAYYSSTKYPGILL
jgi:hypothetical protein